MPKTLKHGLPPPRHVTIAVGCAVVSGRNNMAGILRYINTGRRWNIEFVQNFDRLTDADIRRIVDSGTDGFILGLPEAEAALPALMRSSVPTVVTVQPETTPIPANKSRNTVFLDVDNAAIGTKAASYLLERGAFRSFAFVSSHPAFRWSSLRRDAFVAYLEKRDRKVFVFEDGGHRQDGNMAQTALAGFLADLKPPIAVFAAYDGTALQVVEACQRHGIAVPRQIAVLGVDNDEVLCNFTHPTISSINAGHEELGFRAAAILDAMMNGERTPRSPVIVPVPRPDILVTERDSTRNIPPAGHLVRDILAFISRNAASDIRVDDVVRHLGVSRRLAELRFRQIQDDSIGQAIIRARLEEVKRRLCARHRPLAAIAATCGFASASHLAHFVKRHAGTTPLAIRATSTTR